ncbi:MAG TPA: glycosyltransferase [Chitinophagaceae bacterium]|nr:glycosyltransferase [Chitinophagaceae bacterium]
MKKIVFSVTNDLNYDQRMIRICSSLSAAGYKILLVGRARTQSTTLDTRPYEQKRLNCWFQKGKVFYIEYNIRLFFFLLFTKMDCICAIDLDTILPCYFISVIKKTKRVYDAHELFCEMKEIVTRPFIYKTWKCIERLAVPKFQHGYTVNQPIADEFKKLYNVNYSIIRNVPILHPSDNMQKTAAVEQRFLLYQGDVNEGRSFETLIPAMKKVPLPLIVYGDGNFFEQAKQLVKQNNLEDKVIFKGRIKPEELRSITPKAYLGITFFENNGLSNYLSLANKFFDYIHAGVPQLCVGYPAYKEINNQFEVAHLIDDLSAENIATQLNFLLDNNVLYNRLRQNCLEARKVLNWQTEEKELITFYKKLLG